MLYIQNNYITSSKYIKICKNIVKDGKIDIAFFTENNIPSSDNIIICDPSLEIKNSYSTFISGIKKILQSMKNTIQKMDFLKDIAYCVPILIISAGPSSGVDMKKLYNIQDIYIIVCVKYNRDILLKNNIIIDFMITSDFSNSDFDNININEEDTISFHVNINNYKKENNYKKDFICVPMGTCHSKTFRNIEKTQDIGIISFTNNKIKNDDIYFNCAHIMLEISIPLSLHIGCKIIHTLGWDGPINNIYSYLYNNKKIAQENIPLETEYTNMKYILSMFKKNNIYIYKCNQKSPIELEYKNILDT